jgi:recombination associated protein RdgC
MFSNFTPYRYSGPVLAASLSLPAFAPCLPSQEQSIGFVPNDKHLIVRIERKTVPKQALDRRVAELAAQIEETTGRKPGKKARAELKEQAFNELLPRAFSKTKDVHLTFLEGMGLLLVGSTSSSDTDLIAPLLCATQDGLAISLLQTRQSPASVMSAWLLDLDDVPHGMGIGRCCVLEATDDSHARVRYDDHALDCENVREHLVQGKIVTSLALEHGERVGFTLTEGLQFKSVELLDVVFEGHERPTDSDLAADAELFLWRAELPRMLAAVIDEFGGVLS